MVPFWLYMIGRVLIKKGQYKILSKVDKHIKSFLCEIVVKTVYSKENEEKDSTSCEKGSTARDYNEAGRTIIVRKWCLFSLKRVWFLVSCVYK